MSRLGLLAAFIYFWSILPASHVLGGPSPSQGALDWFLLYLPYILGVLAIIALIIYSIREEKKA